MNREFASNWYTHKDHPPPHNFFIICNSIRRHHHHLYRKLNHDSEKKSLWKLIQCNWSSFEVILCRNDDGSRFSRVRLLECAGNFMASLQGLCFSLSSSADFLSSVVLRYSAIADIIPVRWNAVEALEGNGRWKGFKGIQVQIISFILFSLLWRWKKATS